MITGVTNERIGAAAANDRVIIRATKDAVRSGAAGQRIVAAEAVHCIRRRYQLRGGGIVAARAEVETDHRRCALPSVT